MRLSQCMIVKNEEQNIEKALSWGRDIAFEQIVVDTGSADRTVEMAKKLGAKVFHFEWINNYAAAKNYAIEQASGEWIAFLDADEYFSDEDAQEVIKYLNVIENDDELREHVLAVFCPWVQLRDDGSVMSIDTQMRLFRNIPDIRYIGRIHEWLSLDWENAVTVDKFRIMHTGYSESAYKKTGKTQRNIELIRMEIEDKPDDMNFKAYLAESLMADAMYGTGGDGAETQRAEAKRAEAQRAEARKLFLDVALCDSFVLPSLKRRVYINVLDEYIQSPDTDEKYETAADNAIREFPDDCYIICRYAGVLNKKGKYARAMEMLRKCEAEIDATEGDKQALTAAVIGILSAQMLLAAQGLGDLDTVIKYAGVQLMLNKENIGLLRPYIATCMKHFSLTDANNALGRTQNMLAGIYDLNNQNDMLLVARAAKDVGAIELAKRILN